MLLTDTIIRIKDQVATFSDRVGGTTEFAAAQEMQETLAVPHAFVMPLADLPSTSLEVFGVLQQIEERLGVLVAVDNTTDTRGQAASDQIESIRGELWTALLGWSPDPAVYECIEYAGGFHLTMSRARLWHQFDFTTSRIEQSA